MLGRGGGWGMEVVRARGGGMTWGGLDGEELLEQGIGIDDPEASGFVAGGAFGWDEMVPTVDATDALPDHGEAWRGGWGGVGEVPGAALMRGLGRVVPWELGGRIGVGVGRVCLSSTYLDPGPGPHNAYLFSHPPLRFL